MIILKHIYWLLKGRLLDKTQFGGLMSFLIINLILNKGHPGKIRIIAISERK